MSTSNQVDAPAPETRRSRREAALLAARAATVPVVDRPATATSATSAPVPFVRPAATAAATSPYGTLGRPAARVVVPDVEPDTSAPAASAPAAPAPAAAPTVRPVAARPAATRPHELLGRPAPATSWTPVPQPSIARGAELGRAAAAARTTLGATARPDGVTPANPSAVTDTGPLPRTVAVTPSASPVSATASSAPRATSATDARPASPSTGAPAPAVTGSAPAAPAAAHGTRQLTRREIVAAERRRSGRREPRTAPRRPSATRTARVGVLATLAVATVAVPIVQGAAAPQETTVVRDYASGRATLNVLMSPRGVTDTSVIVADTLAGRGLDVASRSEARSTLPDCDATVTAPSSSNGRLSAEQLCKLPQSGHSLQPQAAVAFAELNTQFEVRFGTPICVSDSYRSISSQYSVAARRGAFAARPGTSQHGMGLALDLCPSTYRDSAKWSWLKANGPVYGFDNPAWARRGGSGMYEPWHWEYFPLVER